jgi:4-amino-4-deoxy-L-arabinose transferase-like glycosyltransferase
MSMWRTDTYWFDVAIATTGLMLGHIYFGRFAEHKPRWRLLLKSVLGIAMVVGTTAWAGREWTFALVGVLLVALLVVHGWWLPRNGVNGWTAEPRERYYELIGLDPDGKPRKRMQ